MKDKTKKTDAQLKNSLKQLKKLGLYNPQNSRKAPTRYAKSLIKKYNDVLSGKAEVISIPKAAAKNLKTEFKIVVGKKKAVAVVPKAAGTKAKYSKKLGTVVRNIGRYNLRPYPDKMVLLRGQFPELKRGERLAIRIGNTFRIFKDQDEVSRAIAQYDPTASTLWQYPYIATVK